MTMYQKVLDAYEAALVDYKNARWRFEDRLWDYCIGRVKNNAAGLDLAAVDLDTLAAEMKVKADIMLGALRDLPKAARLDELAKKGTP